MSRGQGRRGEKPRFDPGLAEAVGTGVRAALDALVPDPERSRLGRIDRLNETQAVVPGGPVVQTRVNIAATPGTRYLICDYQLDPGHPLAYITEWWHDIEMGDGSDPSTAWLAPVNTELLVNGQSITGHNPLPGQRADPINPGRIHYALRANDRFEVWMSIDSAWAGNTEVWANAHLRGHLA